jgi:hypothetical protein
MPLAAIFGIALLVFFSPSRSLGVAFQTQESTPEQQPLPQQTQPPSATPQPNTTEAKKPGSTAAPSAAKKLHRKRTTQSAAGSPSKKVVRNGSTVDPPVQLAPAQGQGQGSQSQSTTQLLANVDDNLKKIASRQLNQTQQDSVKQIRLYMDQAKTAEATGNLDRAHNLAVKAQLLSDDLVRH